MSLQFDVVGADGPRRYFESLTRGNVGHAYLFSGEPGVGKKTFARRLAQSILCEAHKESIVGYDGTCRSCALFAATQSRHPDFLEHTGAMKIGDADAAAGFYEEEDLTSRDLVRQLSMQSYEGGERVLLLGDVEFASPAAANALLKFLEEPPNGVVMFLTTSSPNRLLPTIRSRLLDVRFPLLSREQVSEILQRLAYSREDADRGASLGGGSVARAVAALEGDEESLRMQVARWFFDAVAGGSPEPWATRDTLDDGLETIKAMVRDWVVASEGAGTTAAAPDQTERLQRLPPIRSADAVAVLTKIDDAQRLARTNVSPGMVGEIVRMALTQTR